MATEAWMCWLCNACGNGTPPAVCPGCGADESAGWTWRIAEYGPDADWRWACTECWTEGRGEQPPDVCPGCGVAGSFFRSANHGNLPMKHVMESVLDVIFGKPDGETEQ